jgi:hypothetical protein
MIMAHQIPSPQQQSGGGINVACLVDARKEYVDIIVTSLLPHVSAFVKKLSKKAGELQGHHRITASMYDKEEILRNLLQEIPHWSEDIVNDEVQTIERELKHLQTVLQTTFKCNYMILAAVHTNGHIRIPLKVPPTSVLVHAIYKNLALEFEDDPGELLELSGSRLKAALAPLIRDTIRELMPMQELLAAIQHSSAKTTYDDQPLREGGATDLPEPAVPRVEDGMPDDKITNSSSTKTIRVTGNTGKLAAVEGGHPDDVEEDAEEDEEAEDGKRATTRLEW